MCRALLAPSGTQVQKLNERRTPKAVWPALWNDQQDSPTRQRAVGTVILETNIRQCHVVTGNTTKTILKHTRRWTTPVTETKVAAGL